MLPLIDFYISRSHINFWTRSFLNTLQILHWSWTTQEHNKNFIFRLANPVFIFLKQHKSNKWTCSVWILVNLFFLNPGAPTSAQKEMKKKCPACHAGKLRKKLKHCASLGSQLRHIRASCWSRFTLLESYHMTPALWWGEAKAVNWHSCWNWFSVWTTNFCV